MKRRYYTAWVPADVTDDDEQAFDLAVLDIKERQRIYRVPAEWSFVWRRGDYVRVCYRYRA